MESRESLEDLVYRSTLSEGNRAGRGASPWVSVPITFTVCGIFGVSAMLLARQTRTARTIIHSVGVILQEAPDAPAPVRAVPAAPPAPRSQAPAPVPAAAPPPERQPKGPPPQPPDPRQEAAPDAAPRSLPTLDNSRLHGGSAGSGTTAGAAPGTIAGAGGGGNGVMDLDLTQVREKFRPPPPACAGCSSRWTGTRLGRKWRPCWMRSAWPPIGPGRRPPAKIIVSRVFPQGIPRSPDGPAGMEATSRWPSP